MSHYELKSMYGGILEVIPQGEQGEYKDRKYETSIIYEIVQNK